MLTDFNVMMVKMHSAAKNVIISVLGKFGYAITKKSNIRALHWKIEELTWGNSDDAGPRGEANQSSDEFPADDGRASEQEEPSAARLDQLKRKLEHYQSREVFNKTDEDYDWFEKQQNIVENIADFGKSDFAELASWLFASSLINHRVIHQRIDEGSLLWRAVKLSGGPILEIGRAAGGSTICILGASGNRRVISIDRYPQHSVVASRIFSRPDVSQRLTLLTQSSREPVELGSFGMLFIDADHSYEGVAQDIATFWNRLSSHDGKPPLAIFHDAADNPITFVEPVKQVCDELLAIPGVARRVESWGSMLLVEKLADIDEDAWHLKENKAFWISVLGAPEALNPSVVSGALSSARHGYPRSSENLLGGDDFDSPDWRKAGIDVLRLPLNQDNPIRKLQETLEFGGHGFSRHVDGLSGAVSLCVFLRPVTCRHVRLQIETTDGRELAWANYYLWNESRIGETCTESAAEILNATFLYQNGFFRCDLEVVLPPGIAQARCSLQMLNDAGGAEYEGQANRSIALNAVTVRNISVAGGTSADAMLVAE